MVFLLQQFLPIVLAINIQQIGAQLAQRRRSGRPEIDAAHAPAVGRYLPLDMQLILLDVPPHLLQLPAQRPDRPVNSAVIRPVDAPERTISRETRAPVTAPRAPTMMDFPAPVSPVSTCSPWAKAISARSITAIFSKLSKGQHLYSPYLSRCSVSCSNRLALSSLRMSRKTVSSPAMEPTTSAIFIPSMAAAAAMARPEKV